MPFEIHCASVDRQIALAEVLKYEHNFISPLGILCEELLHLPLGKANNLIIGRSAVTHFFTALLTPVDDHPPFLRMLVDPDWLHEAKTQRFSVSRTRFINMFAKKANRTVISAGAIAQISYRQRAVFTDEWLLDGDEDHSIRMLTNSIICIYLNTCCPDFLCNPFFDGTDNSCLLADVLWKFP